MKIYDNMSELIGNTPLLRAERFKVAAGGGCEILVKLERFNPGGSVKDRVALAMIEDAEKRGVLKRGSVIIEPTSGNTGVGLAAVGVPRGYRVILTMPETMSVERVRLFELYGAEVVLTDGKSGMSGAIARAEELARDLPDAVILGQFVNPVNPKAHYGSTGPEIWRDTDGNVDILVCGVGTGGTLSGAGRFLKEQNPNIKVIAVEPDTSPVLSGGKAGEHGIMGIGAGFVPATLDADVFDEVVTVSAADACEAARLLARTEGVLCGISSGAALRAAIDISKRKENAGKTVVAVLPDTGERYLSVGAFTGK